MYELVKFPNLCLSLFKKTNINQIATLPFVKYTQDFHYAYYLIQGLPTLPTNPYLIGPT
jgi:hypothetical protein